MPDMSLTEAEAELARSLAARAAVLRGEYAIGSRSRKPPSLEALNKDIDYWRGVVNRLGRGGNGGMRVRGLTPT